MEDAKTTKEAFRAYHRWQKYILGAGYKPPKGYSRTTLVAYALAMAIKGTNGLGCFASDKLIAKEIGIYRRERVGDYRHLALDLGWFVRTGKRRGRAEELDISIPSAQHDAEAAPSETVATVAERLKVLQTLQHADVRVWDCPACKRVFGDLMASDQLSQAEQIELIQTHDKVLDLQEQEGRMPPSQGQSNAPLRGNDLNLSVASYWHRQHDQGERSSRFGPFPGVGGVWRDSGCCAWPGAGSTGRGVRVR
jgi:hypothetical protein